MNEPTTAREILLAMIDAFDAGDQPRYAALFQRLKDLHTEAAKAIRNRNQ